MIEASFILSHYGRAAHAGGKRKDRPEAALCIKSLRLSLRQLRLDRPFGTGRDRGFVKLCLQPIVARLSILYAAKCQGSERSANPWQIAIVRASETAVLRPCGRIGPAEVRTLHWPHLDK